MATVLQGLQHTSPAVACAACACTARFVTLGGPGMAPVAQMLLDTTLPLLKRRQQTVSSSAARVSPSERAGPQRLCCTAQLAYSWAMCISLLDKAV